MDRLNILYRTNLQSAILSINKNKNGVSLITQDYRTCEFDGASLKKPTKLINSRKIPHPFAKSSSAGDGFACACEVGNPRAIVAKLNLGAKPIAMIKSHAKDISASSFSRDSTLLATGGEDGRVFVFKTSNFKKILSLPPRPDYISALNFSRDGRFIFAPCFDKSNIVFDYIRAKNISIFHTNEVVEWGEFFDNNTKLLLITRDFQSIIYDIKNSEVLSTASLFSSWPNICRIDESEEIAIVGARDGAIYLINIKENTSIFQLNLSAIGGISALCIHNGCIFVGSVNGEFLVVNYSDSNERFKKACEAKNYAIASKMMESNIFLSLLPCAKVFDRDWSEILKEAVKLISEDRANDALGLAHPFTSKDISKKNALEVYLSKKDAIKQFREFIDNRFYEEAYNMSLSHKFLLKTAQYAELESHWHNAFSVARRILEENHGSDSAKNAAKKHLEVFMKTPKKEAILQLLNNLRTFDEADKLIKAQKFREYFALIGQFGYLKEMALYRKVLALGAQIYNKAIEANNAQNYEKFDKLAKVLHSFPEYRESIADISISIHRKQEFLRLIYANRKAEAYKLALEFEELQYLDEFKSLCAEFDAVAQKAIEVAHSGNPGGLSEIFGEYMQIKFWSDKIRAIFQVAYLEEFALKMKNEKDAINWEHSVKNYIQIFGKDDDICAFCAQNGLKFEIKDFYKQPFSYQKSLISRVV